MRAILHRLDQIKLLGGSIRGAISESNMELRPAKMRLESRGRERQGTVEKEREREKEWRKKKQNGKQKREIRGKEQQR